MIASDDGEENEKSYYYESEQKLNLEDYNKYYQDEEQFKSQIRNLESEEEYEEEYEDEESAGSVESIVTDDGRF